MKKFFTYLFFSFSSLIVLAQEEMEKTTRDIWSYETKMSIAAAFVVIVVILVIRTLRNKPEA